MFFYEGQTCPVCGRRFNETDDVVACPVCGAPHHRECWRQEGHCHFADAHGTDHQWAQSSPQDTDSSDRTVRRCPRCGAENPEFSEFCAHCGAELTAKEWSSEPKAEPEHTSSFGQYTPPFGGFSAGTPLQDPYGGVPRTETIDGVSVDRMAELIGPNSRYYLPRFHRMTHGGSKASWNWAAFLVPYNWLLYRKNIVFGILTFVFYFAVDFVNQLASSQMEASLSGSTMEAMVASMQAYMQTPQGQRFLLISGIATLVLLAVHLLIGFFGNYLYLRTLLKRAKAMPKTEEPVYGRRNPFWTGGTSFALAVAPYIFEMVLMYLLVFLKWM